MNVEDFLQSDNVEKVLWKYSKHRTMMDIADRLADHYIPSMQNKSLKYDIELKKRLLNKDQESDSLMKKIGTIGLSALAGSKFPGLASKIGSKLTGGAAKIPSKSFDFMNSIKKGELNVSGNIPRNFADSGKWSVEPYRRR